MAEWKKNHIQGKYICCWNRTLSNIRRNQGENLHATGFNRGSGLNNMKFLIIFLLSQVL